MQNESKIVENPDYVRIQGGIVNANEKQYQERIRLINERKKLNDIVNKFDILETKLDDVETKYNNLNDKLDLILKLLDRKD